MLSPRVKVKLQRFADHRIGDALCTTLSLFQRRKKLYSTPKRILLVKLWAVGESILTLPLLEQLRKRYPAATIDVLTRRRNEDVYTGQPFINSVLLAENTREILKLHKQYDIAIDAEPYLNSSALLAYWLAKQTIGFSHGARAKLYQYKIHYDDEQHAVQTYLDMARPLFTPTLPKRLVPLKTEKEDILAVRGLFKKESIKHPLLGICTGAAESARSRMWPGERFLHIINTYTSKGWHVILVGSPSEQSYNEELSKKAKHEERVHNIAGKTTLKQLFEAIKNCDLFLSNDTGPMHVAAAQRVPTLGLFCPNSPTRFGPYGPKNNSIYKPILEKPCINVHKREVPDCTNHDHLSNITTKNVIKELEKLSKLRKYHRI